MRNLNVDEQISSRCQTAYDAAYGDEPSLNPGDNKPSCVFQPFPEGSVPEGSIVYIQPSLLSPTWLWGPRERKQSRPLAPPPPTDTRAALWRSRSPRSDSRRRSHKHSPAWREDGIMGFFCFCSPLCAVLNGTLSRPSISIRPNTSR